MKLHKNLIEAIVRTLQQIFNEGKYADKAIEKVLASDNRWGARDRGFIAENTYDMVRWWRLLSFVSGETKKEYETELSIEKAWHIFGIWLLLSGKETELPDWREFKKIDRNEVSKLSSKADGIRKVRESIPDWLDELGEKELGEYWESELKGLNKTANVIIRANSLKTTRTNLQDSLAELNMETTTVDGYNDALILKHRTNLFITPFFKQGFFEVQDASSQMVSKYLQVQPNMRVIDACAGAGGKTLHLAALMENKGKVIAMDKEQWKLDALKLRARRAGAHNIEMRHIENSKTIKRLQESADRLLLDVPCSGLGVLKRNPDAKWKLSQEFIEKVKQMQFEILTSYSSMLKIGGLMVYATCSILPSEGEEQIKRFLSGNNNFQQIEELRISPAMSGFDGFYMTLLRKK